MPRHPQIIWILPGKTMFGMQRHSALYEEATWMLGTRARYSGLGIEHSSPGIVVQTENINHMRKAHINNH